MRTFLRFVVIVVGCALVRVAAAAPPIWLLEQIYTNADGSSQFAVFATAESGQQHLTGQTLVVTERARQSGWWVKPPKPRTFTFPNDLPADSANRSLLIATQGFAALALVVPDYVVPNGFFPLQNGAVSFAGDGADSYGVLPTDGVYSAHDPDQWTVDLALATNFSGAQYAFPEPPAPLPPIGTKGWKLMEVYSSADRSIQFAVLASVESGQQALAGRKLYSANALGSLNVFTVPTNLPGDSANHSVLVATQGFAALNVVKPDYVVPNGFFFVARGSITLGSLPVFSRPLYSLLPSDGINAIWITAGSPGLFGTSIHTAVATNFAGDRYVIGSGNPLPPPPPPPPPCAWWMHC